MENNLFVFKNSPVHNVFAPTWNHPIYEGMITKINFKTLAKFILQKEKEILSEQHPTDPNDAYTGLGKNSLTSRYGQYNILDWKHPAVPKLKQAILKFHECFLKMLTIPLYPQLYIQCWANVMRQGEQIKPHLHSTHSDSYLGGHIVVQAQKTQTHYINPVNQLNEPAVHSSLNTVGKISLFRSCMAHYTDAHTSDKPRITIAFDLLVNGEATQHNYRKIK